MEMPDMTARRRSLLTCAAMAALAAAGAPGAVQAQETQLAQATVRPPYMDRIVVTATRSERELRENVGNIATIDEAELMLVGPHVASEVLNRLPGINVQRGSGQEHLTAIRSPVLSAGAGAGSFLYLEEGVPMRAAGFANVNGLFEANEEIAAGIEAIRGPGGALYGSNAVHGVINFLVRGPETEPGNYLEFSYGSFDRFTTQGWTSRTLDDEGSGYFVGFSGLSDGGYRADSGVDDQKVTARFDFNRGRMTTKTIISAVNINQETAGYAPDYEGPLRRSNPNPEAYRDVDAVRWSTRIDVEQDNGWTLSATPFARTNFMEFNQHFLPYGGTETNGHWSVGAQLAAYKEMERGGFIVGADVEYTEGFLREFQDRPSFGAFPQGFHYDYTVDATVIAPYAHLDRELTERLRLEAGLRYEMTDYEYVTNIPAGISGRFFVPADRSDDYGTLTPNIGLAYDFDEATIGWVRYVRGARAPQTTDAYRLQNRQVVGEIDTETLDSIEAGVRGERGSSVFELVGFYGYKKNFFFRDADGLNVADGETESYGIEASAAVDITDTLMLRGSGTLASHTYQFDRTVAAVGETIRSGDRIDTAPEFLLNAQLVWTPIENFTAELAWTHVSEYFTDAENLRTYPGHDVFDLRARWQVTDAINVFGAVRNLFDTEYAERADYGFGSDRYFPGEGQAFQVGFGASF
jgi:outer membrane receptor protein involved in Fe transport